MDELGKIKSEVTGFIIAGGQSERFGGDKRNYIVSGMTLTDRTIGIMKELLGSHPFVVGDNLDGFNIKPEYLLGDARRDSGPLGGLVAALDNCHTVWCLTLAVDLPYITLKDLQLLVSSADESFDVISLSAGRKPEPLIALYHRKTAAYWKDRLAADQLSISDGLQRLRCKKVLPVGGLNSLRNINSPEDIISP